MNKAAAVKSLASTDGFFRHWMCWSQRKTLIHNMYGEEGNYFADLLNQLKARIEAMPKTYETEAIDSQDKVVHLHYFRGNVDAWIIEKDMGDGSEDIRQHQAFGRSTLYRESFSNAEWGYISIQDLISNNVELDLYWEPKTVKELSSEQHL